MPIEFDPEWEYYCSNDPEIVEILNESAVIDNPLDLLIDDRLNNRRNRQDNRGMRFGIGNPDSLDPERLRERQERTGRVYNSKCNDVVCPECKEPFRQIRPHYQYCSVQCANARTSRITRVRKIQICCLWCKSMVEPKRVHQKFCGRKCSGLHSAYGAKKDVNNG